MVRLKMSENIYLPQAATIKGMKPETIDVTTFQIALDGSDGAKKFDYKSGQFAEISVLGVGEAPISITSSPTHPETIDEPIDHGSLGHVG